MPRLGAAEPESRAVLYLDLILAALPAPCKIAVEMLMESKQDSLKTPHLDAFLARLNPRVLQQGREEGREQGREEGLRLAIRTVLDARGILLDEERAQLLDACTDRERLLAWARRAAFASDAREVFDDAT